MNVSLEWLKEYVATTTPARPLGEKFRMTSSEMEDLHDYSTEYSCVVVGHVTHVETHPNADRLRVAKVSVGKDSLTIVCGGKNLAVDQYVIVALPGATVTSRSGETVTITETELRGVVSEGMICAYEELGIPIHSDGVIVLPEPIAPGTPASTALFHDDAVINLEITPNRPDLLGHLGLAREVAAFEHRRLIEPQIASLGSRQNHARSIELKVESHRDCPRYTGIALEVASTVPSPWWMQSRLIRCGIRPINAIVDVTNYVMLELGQPLHAFDLRVFTQEHEQNTARITVRSARSGESLTTLDGIKRVLEPGDIVVTDASDRVIDLAGIMGGIDSAIQPETTTILLEAATFSGPHIRRTSRRLGLRTDASSRFEKGLDPELPVTALKRAVYLLQQIADARVISRLVESSSTHPRSQHRISVRFTQIEQVLGVRISAADCKAILTSLGFHLPVFTKSGFEVVPPSWRSDVIITEDVIEELIRIWGYEHLPHTLPVGSVKPPVHHAALDIAQTIRHALAGFGYREVLHMPFASIATLHRAGYKGGEYITLPNPLSTELACLIPSHTPLHLTTLGSTNINQPDLAIFEMGSVFSPPRNERKLLTITRRSSGKPEDALRTLKADLERLAQLIGVTFDYKPSTESGLEILLDTQVIGTMKFIEPTVLDAFKFKRARTVLIAEMDHATLASSPLRSPMYRPISEFPESQRDITLTIPTSTPFTTVEKAISMVSCHILKHWALRDIFTGKNTIADERAITIRFTFGAPDRTLEDREINEAYATLEQSLREAFTQ